MADEIVDVEVVGGPRITIQWVSGMNAQDAVEAAHNKASGQQPFTFALQYYGPQLGYLVMMINETYDSFRSTSAPFFYWEFLVNGDPARQGIDNTPLQPGDHVLFSFERYQPDRHARSLLQAKYDYQIKGGPSV